MIIMNILRILKSALRGKPVQAAPSSIADRYPDFSVEDVALMDRVSSFTMTSLERQYSLIQSLRYIIDNNIKGDLVECGVWRGGSAMLMALVLQERGLSDRKFYLYDTFEGMTEPGKEDVSYSGEVAAQILDKRVRNKEDVFWAYASVEDVQQNIAQTGYPEKQFHYIKGDVGKTIPETIPDEIALLRLDTDWYQSTYHELQHLFPRLVKGGVMIIDDYGHWQGARKAVDQYLAENRIKILLNRVDYTGRIAVKL